MEKNHPWVLRGLGSRPSSSLVLWFARDDLPELQFLLLGNAASSP